jgi:hypothetical protein
MVYGFRGVKNSKFMGIIGPVSVISLAIGEVLLMLPKRRNAIIDT